MILSAFACSQHISYALGPSQLFSLGSKTNSILYTIMIVSRNANSDAEIA